MNMTCLPPVVMPESKEVDVLQVGGPLSADLNTDNPDVWFEGIWERPLKRFGHPFAINLLIIVSIIAHIAALADDGRVGEPLVAAKHVAVEPNHRKKDVENYPLL